MASGYRAKLSNINWFITARDK
jgi:hypothetical protein